MVQSILISSECPFCACCKAACWMPGCSRRCATKSSMRYGHADVTALSSKSDRSSLTVCMRTGNDFQFQSIMQENHAFSAADVSCWTASMLLSGCILKLLLHSLRTCKPDFSSGSGGVQTPPSQSALTAHSGSQKNPQAGHRAWMKSRS